MTYNVSASLKAGLLALVLTTPMALLARADTALPAAATPEQATATKLVYGLLSDSRYAYRPRTLDEAMSKDVFKRYLETLDGGKQFFTQADVDAFAPLQAGVGDALRGGNLEPAFQVFSVYKKRVDQRVKYARELLKQDFDFTGSKKFEYDRKDVPWAADDKQLDVLWRQSVMNDWLRLKLAGKKSDDIRKTLDKRYATLADSVNELKGEDAFQFFLNAYTNAVDPHTDYFTPRTAETFNQQMSLSLEGIGAQLQKQDDMVVIREVIPGGPAAVDGTLKPGDRIVGVGQAKSGAIEDVIGWRIDDVVAKIRGSKDAQVRLEYIPASWASTARTAP